MTVEQTINIIIQGEMKEIVNFNGAPYIKFQMLTTAIEFLGACMDKHDFQEKALSEERFNNALKKLFNKKYLKYAKKNSAISLYEELRCGMVHKLRPKSSRIRLTQRKNIINTGIYHLKEDNENTLYVVLEDLYNDIYEACEEIKRRYNNGKLPTKKMEENFIHIDEISSGHTKTILTNFKKYK